MYALRPGWFGSAAAAVTVTLLAQAGLGAESKSAEDWFREGIEHLNGGKLDEAVSAFQFCTEANPDLKECWYNLGVALGRQRNFAKEARAYQEAILLDPKYGRAHFNLAVALEDLGRTQEAMQHYDAAIEAEPTAQDAHLNRAMLLLSLEKLDPAIAGFEKAIAVQPETPEPYYDLAEAVHLKAQKLEEPQRTAALRRAITAYQQCLQRDPTHHRALYNIGVVQHRLKDLDSEIAAYRKALELRPNYTPALYNLGFALRDKGDREEAKVALVNYLRAAGKQASEMRFVEAAERELKKL